MFGSWARIVVVLLAAACAQCSGTATVNDASPADHGDTSSEPALDSSVVPDSAADVASIDASADAVDDTDAVADITPDLTGDTSIGDTTPDAPLGTFTQQTYSGAAGTRSYWVFEPAGLPATPVPLVVVLHGCLEDGPTIAASSQYSVLAAATGFLVVYPEQDPTANSSRCWNWFLPADEQRDSGEPAILAGITREVMSTHVVDPHRVYVIGISAGGAMSVVMGATYPDLFAAIGVVAGCAYQDGSCLNLSLPAPTATLGASAYMAMGTYARVMPVFVLQGDADPVVAPANAERVVQQWITTDDYADDGFANGSIATTPQSTEMGMAPNGHAYSIDHYVDGTGAPLIDRWLIQGLVHAWPGGGANEPFTDPEGPSATDESWSFFASHPMP